MRHDNRTGQDFEWGQWCKVLEALSHIIDRPEVVAQIKKITDINHPSHIEPTIKLLAMLIEIGVVTKVEEGMYRLAEVERT